MERSVGAVLLLLLSPHLTLSCASRAITFEAAPPHRYIRGLAPSARSVIHRAGVERVGGPEV